MKTALATALAGLALAGCDRFGDHPEKFIRVHTGTGEKIRVYSQPNFLRVEGVMTIDGPDKIAAPINLTTVECNFDQPSQTGYCEVVRAEIMNFDFGPVLMNRRDLYMTKEWSDVRVIAVLEEPCRTNELRIDIPGNTVTEVTENTPGGSCSDDLVGGVAQTRIARLISGDELEKMKRDL